MSTPTPTTRETEAGKVRLKAATPTPAATSPAEPPADGRTPLDMALGRLKATREKDVEAALTVYRMHAQALATDKRLSVAEMDALAHAIGVLNLTADDLRADVLVIRERAAQIRHAEQVRAVVAELEPQQGAWVEEERRIRERLAEIGQQRGRLNSAYSMAGGHEGHAQSLTAKHPRLFAPLAEAVAAATAPPTGPYVPKVIRSGDGAPPKGTGPAGLPNMTPAGLDLGRLG